MGILLKTNSGDTVFEGGRGLRGAEVSSRQTDHLRLDFLSVPIYSMTIGQKGLSG